MIQLYKECLHCKQRLEFKMRIDVNVLLKKTFSDLHKVDVAFTLSSVFCMAGD